MAWTSPRTWVAGELATAALFNTHLRDNLSLLKTSLDDTGKLQSLSSSYVAAPPLLYSDTTPVGNVGAGTDDLKTYTLAAGLLATNGWGVRIKGGGVTAGNVTDKQVGFKFNATQVIITTASALNAKGWHGEVDIVRLDATNQRITALFMAGYNAGSLGAEYLAGTETLANALPVTFLGVGGADNDVVQHWMTVEQFRT